MCDEAENFCRQLRNNSGSKDSDIWCVGEQVESYTSGIKDEPFLFWRMDTCFPVWREPSPCLQLVGWGGGRTGLVRSPVAVPCLEAELEQTALHPREPRCSPLAVLPSFSVHSLLKGETFRDFSAPAFPYAPGHLGLQVLVVLFLHTSLQRTLPPPLMHPQICFVTSTSCWANCPNIPLRGSLTCSSFHSDPGERCPRRG